MFRIIPLILIAGLFIIGCGKEEPIPVDPNLDKYKVETMKVWKARNAQFDMPSLVNSLGGTCLSDLSHPFLK